jgi:hypothetical protein
MPLTDEQKRITEQVEQNSGMSKKIVESFGPDEIKKLNRDEVEDPRELSQAQLDNARIFKSREEYIKSLKKGLRYMEVGVAWGYYSELVCESANPSVIDLVCRFDQDMKCWSWRRFGECQCKPIKHTYDFSAEESEDFIKNKFSKYGNVTTYKGDAEDILPTFVGKEYDYIYIDIHNGRAATRKVLSDSSKLIPVDGIIGLNDYLIYDGIIDGVQYGTFQTVNEFLYYNKNWSVDALALHKLGFYDIYLRRIW